MHIVVMDGQGGRLGAQLVKEIKSSFPEILLTAIGTNALATAAMLKAGADAGATGENPAVVAAKGADIIVGPIGIVIADSMLGEVTEKMALAVSRASATRILIPVNRCSNLIAGVGEQSTAAVLSDAVEKIRLLLENA